MPTITDTLKRADGTAIAHQYIAFRVNAPTATGDGVISMEPVRVKTDAGGAFSATLLPGRCVAVWRTAPMGSAKEELDLLIPAEGGPFKLADVATSGETELRQQVLAWAIGNQYVLDGQGYINGTGPVTWPDGKVGTYTCLIYSVLWQVPDSFSLTYPIPGGVLRVLQPAVTRDASGVVTSAPPPTIS